MTEIAKDAVDECRAVEIPTDTGPRAIRLHGAQEPTAEVVVALGQLVRAAEELMAYEHPNADVIQELMLAWTRTRTQVDDHNVKARMSAAIAAIRDRLDRVQADADALHLRALAELLRGGQLPDDRCRAAIDILSGGDNAVIARAVQTLRSGS